MRSRQFFGRTLLLTAFLPPPRFDATYHPSPALRRYINLPTRISPNGKRCAPPPGASRPHSFAPQPVIPDSSPQLRPNPIEFLPSDFDWPTWTRERIGSLDSIALARPASSPPCPQEISATVKAPVSPNLRQMVFSSSPARLRRSCGCAGQPQLYCLYCVQQPRRRGIVCVPVASAERRFWCSLQKFVALLLGAWPLRLPFLVESSRMFCRKSVFQF